MVLFELEDDSGSETYGIPTSNIVEVSNGELAEEGDSYRIWTHYRGKSNRYYQVVFHIEDYYPAERDNVVLFIDMSQRINTPDIPLCHYQEKGCDIWYQPTKYKKKKGEWEVASRGIREVHSITTSGVFRVIAKDKTTGEVIHSEGNPSRMIYVLPSSVTIEEYKQMLKEMLDFNPALIKNDLSTVGIGAKTWNETDVELIKRILSNLAFIMTTPTESMIKTYERTSLNKQHVFDTKVMKSYAQSGGAGKIDTIKYVMNVDTYENRIIKQLLNQIYEVTKKGNTIIDPNFIITDKILGLGWTLESEVNEVIRTDKHNPIQYNCVGEIRTITTFESGHDIVVELGRNPNGFAHVFIRPSAEAYLYAAENGTCTYYLPYIITQNPSETIYVLEKMCEIMQLIEEGKDCKVAIACRGYRQALQEKKDKVTYYSNKTEDLDGFTINGKETIKPYKDISISEYAEKICQICHKYPGMIIINDQRFEQVKSEDERRILLKELNARKENIEMFSDTTPQILRFLESDWFEKVRDTVNQGYFRETPKFRMNKNYRNIYRSARELLMRHPVLSSSFTLNAYGVKSTQAIYEIWVFQKILAYLLTMGFEIINHDTGNTSIRMDFDRYLRTEMTSEGYEVELNKPVDADYSINVKIGYNCRFDKYKPDIYMVVYGPDNCKHWYFFDAKYNVFGDDKTEGYCYNVYEMIYDVSIKKYIWSIRDDYDKGDNRIMGSYIICSRINMHGNLSSDDRLFGSCEGILSRNRDLAKEDVEASTVMDYVQLKEHEQIKNSLPAHRYGAIQLSPENDIELITLFQLIFEYLETDAQERKNQNAPTKNLSVCWRCGSTDLDVITTMTASGFPKYYTTCKKCGTFRVENHCSRNPKTFKCNRAINKYRIGNYHHRISEDKDSLWYFECPRCADGHKVKQSQHQEAPPLTDEQLTEMQKYIE